MAHALDTIATGHRHTIAWPQARHSIVHAMAAVYVYVAHRAPLFDGGRGVRSAQGIRAQRVRGTSTRTACTCTQRTGNSAYVWHCQPNPWYDGCWCSTHYRVASMARNAMAIPLVHRHTASPCTPPAPASPVTQHRAPPPALDRRAPAQHRSISQSRNFVSPTPPLTTPTPPLLLLHF